MASLHRKLFTIEQPEKNSTPTTTTTTTTTVQTCLYFCDSQVNDTGTGFCPQACLAICPSICKYSLPVLILPPNSSPQPNNPHAHNLSPLLISMLIILASAFLLITFYALYTKLYHHHQNPNPRTRPSDLLDEEHGRTVVFHPIWYIPTVGLNPYVISSITVHQYGGRKESGAVHVEGTDCAVCLAEFQEGDHLRVLPKCSHAFHIPCIDTWLRSHTNCPICRAPVVISPDHDQTAEKSSPSLRGVGAAAEDQPSDGDELRINIIRRSASMDGIIEEGEINKGSGFSNLVSRSMSCSAKLFSSPSL